MSILRPLRRISKPRQPERQRWISLAMAWQELAPRVLRAASFGADVVGEIVVGDLRSGRQ
jgi:hypothetical protein